MRKQKSENLILSEHVFEIRHVASGSFLDVRGYVADYIKNTGMFPHWRIDTNIIQFFDSPKKIEKEGAFAGYKNAGYIVNNPDTHNYFQDRAISYWKKLLKNEHYKIPVLNRFGVRSKIFIPSEQSFNDLNILLYNKLFSKSINKIVPNKKEDLQIVIKCKDSKFSVRLIVGPIHKEEAFKYMHFEEDELKKCGIYIDLDYYKADKINHTDIPSLLKESMTLTWAKINNLTKELGI